MGRVVTVMMTAQVMGVLVLEATAEAGLEKVLLPGLQRLAKQK